MATTIKPGKLSHEPAVGYTPTVAKDAYRPVVLGSHPYMTNLAIAANQRGSLLARGGTYMVTSGGMSDAAPTHGANVWYCASLDTFSVSPAGEADGTYVHFGRVCPGTAVVDNGSSNYKFEVEHDPNGEVTVVS